MKWLVNAFTNRALIALCAICIIACSNNDQSSNQTKAKDLRMNDIVHETLSEAQVARITAIQEALSEVNSTSLEQTIENFKRDRNPDNEIEVWEEIVQAYDKFNVERKDLSLAEKHEVYNLLLLRSMVPTEKVLSQLQLQHLDKESAMKVLSYYKEEHKPILFQED